MQFVIIKPILTEVSVKDAQNGKFTFLVHKGANKTEIRKAIESFYNVNVIGITTVNIHRRKVIYTKIGRRKVEEDIKKARVELKKGQTIPAFETEDKKKKKEEKTEEK